MLILKEMNKTEQYDIAEVTVNWIVIANQAIKCVDYNEVMWK